MAQVDLTISISTTQAKSLEFARYLARDDDFRARVANDPLEVLREYGFDIEGGGRIHFPKSLPPKHIVEEALVNVNEASEFVALDEFESEDPFAFWLFAVLIAV